VLKTNQQFFQVDGRVTKEEILEDIAVSFDAQISAK